MKQCFGGCAWSGKNRVRERHLVLSDGRPGHNHGREVAEGATDEALQLLARAQKVSDDLIAWARDFLAAVGVLADAKNREVAERCAVRIAAAKPNAARLASLRRIMKAVEKEIKDLKERASQNKAYARGKWREARAEMLAEARARRSEAE